jgi:hypothetical protein
VLAELVEDLVHLEGGQDRLHEDRGADRAVEETERVLGEGEDVVPETRLEMALELGQVEVGTETAVEQLAPVQ